MLTKLIAVVVIVTVLAAVLLGLRQQRLQMMHEMARTHSQINTARQDVWDLQVRIAERMEPEFLRAAIQRAGLELEPITPSDVPRPANAQRR
jgi:cell division protein FtsL